MHLEQDPDDLVLAEGVTRMVSGCAGSQGTVTERAAQLWRTMIADGWLNLALPEHLGGTGGSLHSLGILMEQCGRHGLVTPFFSSIMLGARVLAVVDTQGRWEQLLREVMSGERFLAFAHDGFAPTAVSARAERVSVGWHIAGRPIAVLGARAASHLIVSAGADGESGLFIVAANDPGIRTRPYPTLRGEDAADIVIDATVSESALLRLPVGETIERLLDEALVTLCWEAVGAMSWLLDATADYAGVRKQFGRPLADFQVIQHRIAEMVVQLEDARAATMLATLATDDPQRRGRTASAAKVVVSGAATYIGEQAIQLHGAMGVTEELAVGRNFRLLTAFGYLLGDRDAHVARYAAMVVNSGQQRTSVILGA
jgi:alkylation response protein AidB-like acyl-CoA dehydrogenase